MAKVCGIVGRNAENNGIARSMARPMMAFGKYEKEYLIEEGINLCRLFLPQEGRAIFKSKDGQTLVAFLGYLLDAEGGEKYSEIVFALFSKYGPDFVKKLNGVFNIVIYQKSEKKLYIFNDRYGVMPLYYYAGREQFVFASEVKSVVQKEDVPKEINWPAWADYFSFRYILGDKTFFKNIKSLPNASVLIYKDGVASIRRYWDYSEIKVDYNRDEKYFIEKGRRLIREAVLKSAGGVKRAVSFLSGGYDSRCLAAALKKYTPVDFVTYTTRHPTGPNDCIFAEKVARRLKVENYFVDHPKNLYQKYFLRKFYLLDGMAQEHLWALPLSAGFKKPTFAFDGLAGDLLLKGLFLDGYNLKFAKDTKRLTSILADQYGYSLFFVKKFFKDPVRRRLDFSRNNLMKELESIPKTENRITIFFAKNRTRNALSISSNNIFFNLVKRFAFLENSLVEFGLSIPPRTKVQDHLYLKILKRSFPGVMGIPTTNDETLAKRLDSIFWKILTRLRLQRILKSFFKNLLFRRNLSREGVRYFHSLIERLEIPDYVNSGLVARYLESEKFDFAFFCLIEHLLWYNMFYEENRELLKKLS